MGWYDMFKDALTMAQKADNIELYRQLLDLLKELQEMQQINFELKKENMQLREQIEKVQNMVYVPDKNFYVQKVSETKEDGPFCSKCWEGEHKQSRLFRWGRSELKCNVCDTIIDLESQDYSRDNEDYESYFSY